MKYLTKLIALSLFLFLFASCTKDSGPIEDCVCTQIHQPVFGKDGKVYGNACLAECAGVSYTEYSPLTKATIWFDTTQENAFCAWYIRIGDKDYTMTNLDKDYYENGLVVRVSYKENLLQTDNICDWKDGRVDINDVVIDN